MGMENNNPHQWTPNRYTPNTSRKMNSELKEFQQTLAGMEGNKRHAYTPLEKQAAHMRFQEDQDKREILQKHNIKLPATPITPVPTIGRNTSNSIPTVSSAPPQSEEL